MVAAAESSAGHGSTPRPSQEQTARPSMHARPARAYRSSPACRAPSVYVKRRAAQLGLSTTLSFSYRKDMDEITERVGEESYELRFRPCPLIAAINAMLPEASESSEWVSSSYTSDEY